MPLSRVTRAVFYFLSPPPSFPLWQIQRNSFFPLRTKCVFFLSRPITPPRPRTVRSPPVLDRVHGPTHPARRHDARARRKLAVHHWLGQLLAPPRAHELEPLASLALRRRPGAQRRVAARGRTAGRAALGGGGSRRAGGACPCGVRPPRAPRCPFLSHPLTPCRVETEFFQRKTRKYYVPLEHYEAVAAECARHVPVFVFGQEATQMPTPAPENHWCGRWTAARPNRPLTPPPQARPAHHVRVL